MRNSKANIESQIKEIYKEILDAESLSILQQGDKEVLNEEGLPIKDIREDVGDEEERTRPVLAEVEPTQMFSMDEIDKMMDEAMEEEQAELAKLQPKSVLKEEKMKQEKLREEMKAEKRGEGKGKASSVIAVAGDGLEVGKVSGEELLAKLVDDSKKRYNPIDDTWIENEDEDGDSDEDYDLEYDDDEEEEEEEEDQYGRTRGFLIPPNLSRGVKQEREVKFASYEKPATPSIGSPVPVKSALKRTGVANPPTTTPPAVPLTSTRTTSVMADSIVERAPSQVLPPLLLKLTGRIPSNKIPRQLAK